MLASELIKTYEEFCPQELFMLVFDWFGLVESV